MESAIEHDRYEFTNPATKHTLSELIDLVHRKGSSFQAKKCEEYSQALALVETRAWASLIGADKTKSDR